MSCVLCPAYCSKICRNPEVYSVLYSPGLGRYKDGVIWHDHLETAHCAGVPSCQLHTTGVLWRLHRGSDPRPRTPPPHLRCPFRIPVLNGNLVSDNGQAPESLPPSAFGMEACPLRNYVRCPEIGLPQPPGMPAVNADWFCPLPPVHPLSFLKVTTCLSRLPGNCLRPHSSIVKGSPRPPETTPGPQSAGVLRVPFRMGLRSYPTYCTSCGFPESDALRDGP